jgi:ribosomal protein S18 acetylase RimI-like enzyme
MITTRRLSKEDAESAASLHLEAFRNFFLSSLGSNFLKEFYQALVLRNDTICQGYWNDDNRLLGFFAANVSHDGFYKDLCKKNVVPFVLSSFRVFVQRPLLLIRLAKSFSSSKQAGNLNYPYLMSICVSPDVQSTGLGKKMIEDLVVILIGMGFKGLYLTTDLKENKLVNAFYSKCNFKIVGVVNQGRRKLNVYFRSF